MESENKLWTISELNNFALKFQKVQVLCNIPWFHKSRPPLESKHTAALKELAAMLGEPLDTRRMEQRVYDFISNMLHLLRDVARERLSWESLPPALNHLGTRLELVDGASAMETGECRATGVVNPAKVKSFATRLVKAVQRAVAERRRSRDWDAARFLKSVDAVEAFARETHADRGAVLQTWLRMYEDTRQELCRAGREPSLSPAEWRLADLLLMHEPALPLLERNGEPVCPERSGCFLVRLVAAAVARLPRQEGEDPVFGASAPPPTPRGDALEYGDWLRSVWTAVHIAFCKRERAVSGVLLQRRWHELRRLALEGCGSAAALLRLLPAAAETAPPPWPSLVQRGLVVDLTALGCQNPDLLCLLDDIEHEVGQASGRADDSSGEADTVRQLQPIDPGQAEVSVPVDPHSDSEPEDGPAPAPADKDDSLSFIIRQALNCRSIVRLQAPRLRELTDDILKKNCILADEQTAAPSSDEEGPPGPAENKPEPGGETGKRPRDEPAERDVAGGAKRQRSEDRGLSTDRAAANRPSLAGEKLARRYGVRGQGPAFWATHLHLARRCRPLRVRLARLPRASPRDRGGILDDELGVLKRSEMPAGARGPEEAKAAPGNNVDPVITVGTHSIRLIEDTRHTAAERKRLTKQLAKGKRVKTTFTSILNEQKQRGRLGGGAAESFADSSCYFKLPVGRSLRAAEFAAQGGGKTALMRADLLKPLWLVHREFVLLTTAPLPFAQPSYWGALQGSTKLALTRVLFSERAVVDLTDEAEATEGDPPDKTLVPDPVYNMVQDIATFRRLNSSRGSLFLLSLRSGVLSQLAGGGAELREVSVYEPRPGRVGDPPAVLSDHAKSAGPPRECSSDT